MLASLLPNLPPPQVLGAPLPYNSLEDVRRRLADVAPHFGRRDAVEAPLWLNGEYFKVRRGRGGVAGDSARVSELLVQAGGRRRGGIPATCKPGFQHPAMACRMSCKCM